MCPVMSVDAAHLKSPYKGTIFIYSGLTANDKAILAFGICGGNQDYTSWNIFNTLFAKACPSVSFVGDGHVYSKFVFISDRIKDWISHCLKFLKESCNKFHHIKQNVKRQFGPHAAEMVFPIARSTTFLTIQEGTLLEQLKNKSASAYDYLEKIPKGQWCNMQMDYSPEVTTTTVITAPVQCGDI